MTAVVDEQDIAGAFEAALAQDAGVTPAADGPAAPAPPRKPDQPAAAEKPARKPRPAKPKGDDAPRTAPVAAVTAGPGKDYTTELTDFGNQVWLGASMMRGGRILGIPIPDARPFAAVWKDALPGGVAAWNQAAKQSAAVRGYVSKLGGEGGTSWVIGVGLWAVGLASAATALAKAPSEVREQVIAANDEQLVEYIADQVKAMGFEIPEEAAA